MMSMMSLRLVVAASLLVTNLGDVVNVVTFGATGNGVTKDTDAIRAAAAHCRSLGGCTLLFPGTDALAGTPMTYLTGSFVLSSHMWVELQLGATLQGSQQPADWGLVPAVPSYDWWGKSWNSEPRYGALLQITDAHNVTVTGGGVVDGNGAWWWSHMQQAPLLGRPMLLQAINASRLIIRNVTLQQSPMYHVHLLYCDDVEVSWLNISTSQHGHNTDGIDPDSSSNVRITDNVIATQDDCVAVKAGQGRAGTRYNRSTTQVLVARNLFLRCGGVAVGSEVAGGVGDVLVKDNVFGEVGNVARIKSCVDYGGFLRNISFVNNTISGRAAEAVFLDACYECRCDGAAEGPDIDVRVSLLQGPAGAAGNLSCAAANPCRVAMDRVDVTVASQGFLCNNVVGTASDVKPKPCWLT